MGCLLLPPATNNLLWSVPVKLVITLITSIPSLKFSYNWIGTEIYLQNLGTDFIGPYPTYARHRCRYCLVIVDYFSKCVELTSLTRSLVKSVATAFFNQFISKFGTPLQVVSDNSHQLFSEVFTDFCYSLQIDYIRTVRYLPQANLAERDNRTLVQLISIYVGRFYKNWYRYLN